MKLIILSESVSCQLGWLTKLFEVLHGVDMLSWSWWNTFFCGCLSERDSFVWKFTPTAPRGSGWGRIEWFHNFVARWCRVRTHTFFLVGFPNRAVRVDFADVIDIWMLVPCDVNIFELKPGSPVSDVSILINPMGSIICGLVTSPNFTFSVSKGLIVYVCWRAWSAFFFRSTEVDNLVYKRVYLSFVKNGSWRFFPIFFAYYFIRWIFVGCRYFEGQIRNCLGKIPVTLWFLLGPLLWFY